MAGGFSWDKRKNGQGSEQKNLRTTKSKKERPEDTYSDEVLIWKSLLCSLGQVKEQR